VKLNDLFYLLPETSAMRKLWKSNRSGSGHGSEVVPLQGSRSQVRSQTASSSQWEAKMMTPAGMGPRSYSLPIQGKPFLH